MTFPQLPFILSGIAFGFILVLIASCSTATEPTTDSKAPGFNQQAAILAGYRPLNDKFAVSPQITVSDVQKIKDAGFTRIINHRPDGEAPEQPIAADIQAEAERLGIKFVDLPYTSGQVTPSVLAGLTTELANSDEPTLAYCRSGGRAVVAWAMSQVSTNQLNPDQVIAVANTAGYPLQSLKPTLEKLALQSINE